MKVSVVCNYIFLMCDRLILRFLCEWNGMRWLFSPLICVAVWQSHDDRCKNLQRDAWAEQAYRTSPNKTYEFAARSEFNCALSTKLRLADANSPKPNSSENVCSFRHINLESTITTAGVRIAWNEIGCSFLCIFYFRPKLHIFRVFLIALPHYRLRVSEWWFWVPIADSFSVVAQ